MQHMLIVIFLSQATLSGERQPASERGEGEQREEAAESH